MTTRLEEAFARAAELPDAKQKQLAQRILAEVQEMQAQASLYTQPKSLPQKVAEKVVGEYRMRTNAYDGHIESDPAIAGGKPRLAGHRITVQNIVIWHERLGMGADEISAEYDLPLAGVYAALAYYFDHREAIDRSIEQDAMFVAELRGKTPSALREKLAALSRG